MSSLRLLNVAWRTVHLVGVSLLVGGAAWDVEWPRLVPALWLTLGSGLGLLLLEVTLDELVLLAEQSQFKRVWLKDDPSHGPPTLPARRRRRR